MVGKQPQQENAGESTTCIPIKNGGLPLMKTSTTKSTMRGAVLMSAIATITWPLGLAGIWKQAVRSIGCQMRSPTSQTTESSYARPFRRKKPARRRKGVRDRIVSMTWLTIWTMCRQMRKKQTSTRLVSRIRRGGREVHLLPRRWRGTRPPSRESRSWPSWPVLSCLSPWLLLDSRSWSSRTCMRALWTSTSSSLALF